jgi:uncharacterized protein (UPF0332 family)
MNPENRQRLIDYRITRAHGTLKEIDILIENKLWNTAINRLYYACYYAVIALLLKHEIKTQTHSGVRQMFGLHFIKNGMIDKNLGKFYTDIFDLRHTGDYDDYIDFTEDDVLDLLEPAKKLVKTIETLL